MIELPESRTLAKQLRDIATGKTVKRVIAGHSPHGFAWFFGDEAGYDDRLRGRAVTGVSHHGGHVEMELGEMRFDVHDGVNLAYYAPEDKCPDKHQIYMEFTDGSKVIGKVQMYGGIYVFADGENDNPYYLVGKQKPDALSDDFDRRYFERLLDGVDRRKTSAKAFLATEQRIPGVGNGVLQDILWDAGINPKTKMALLTGAETEGLFESLKKLLKDMEEKGGRDTEKDLFGNPGGYKTVMSKNNKPMICPRCGNGSKKEAYMGGSVYYCPVCQPLKK